MERLTKKIGSGTVFPGELVGVTFFSNKFRSVCKAESLIYEYRKYHEQFLAWLKLSEEDK